MPIFSMFQWRSDEPIIDVTPVDSKKSHAALSSFIESKAQGLELFQPYRDHSGQWKMRSKR